MATTRRPSGRPSATDIVLGALLAVAGLVLLAAPVLRVVPSEQALGAYFLAAGAVAIAGALVGRTSPGFFSEIVSGAQLTVLGAVVLRYPATLVTTLLLLAGAFFAVTGLVRLAAATEYPAQRAIWLAGGIAALGLASVVVLGALDPSVSTLGLLVGVALVIDGVSALLIGRRGYPSRR